MLRPTIPILTLLIAGSALAGSFIPVSLAPQYGIDVLDRSVTTETLDRELLGSTYGSVTIGNVDIYDRFPYLEAHYFQVLSDPKWNRLVFGEVDRGLDAFDGARSSFGRLSRPHGLATDVDGRLYVADTGNDRVLVMSSSSEFDRLVLTPLYAIDGLSQPYDVAISDRGTPLDSADDVLYVANSGRNQVLRFDLGESSARLTASLGELGSGDDHFAGPMAIAVGRRDGASSDELFVADAHNGRLVRLLDRGNELAWDGSLPHQLGLISSLSTDQYGNLYAAAPQRGTVQKFNRELLPVAELSDGVQRPRNFHVPLVTVHDHTTNTVARVGHGAGVLVEEWTDHSGMRLLNLGVELSQLSVEPSEAIRMSFALSDRAHVVAEIRAAGGARVLASQDLGLLDAGLQQLDLSDTALRQDLLAGSYELHLSARSTYEHGARADAMTAFALAGDRSAALPQRLLLGQALPNPFNPRTTIHWSVPVGGESFELAVYDARGRRVRLLASGIATAGQHSVDWDGIDDHGQSVASGIYHYRLSLGQDVQSRQMVLVK